MKKAKEEITKFLQKEKIRAEKKFSLKCVIG